MHLEENKKNKIKKLLADFLGVEIEDINEDDLLRDDLHMGPVDITDFSHILSEEGLEIKHEDWQDIEVVSDIYDYIVYE